jgi:hypothetical protein
MGNQIMTRKGRWVPYLKAWLLAIVPFCSVLFFAQHFRIGPSESFENSKVFAQQALRIAVLPQRSSPLKISNAASSSTRPDQLDVGFRIENVSKTPIRAYTIRHADFCGSSKTGGFELNNILTKADFLGPGQSIERSVGGTGCPDLITKVELAVDFVEFADGKIWGDDKYKSMERLLGTRAGAADETDELLALVRNLGIAAVVDRLTVDKTDWAVPLHQTDEWINGYARGRQFRRRQIQQAYSAKGLIGIEEALRLPYDASGNEQ